MKREGETKIAFQGKEVTLVMIEYKLSSFTFIQTKSQTGQSQLQILWQTKVIA